MGKQENGNIITLVLSLLAVLALVTTPMPASAINVDATELQKAVQQPDETRLYDVKIERGQFRTASGANRTYTLYIPKPADGMPAGPYPLVVLIHGFFMSGYEQSGNAQYLARHGIVAFTPNLTKMLLGDGTRMGNVRDVLEEVRWLTDEKQGPLQGIVDPSRVGIAGNSAGGAVCLEVLLEAQKANVPIKSVCLLDGVPWDRTWKRLTDLNPASILSLRAEPGMCNFYARLVRFLTMLRFRYDDVKVVGAHHCDVENPYTFGCRCVCGRSTEKNRTLFQRLTYLYFRETLNAPQLEAGQPKFTELVHQLAHNGQVVASLDHLEPAEIASNLPPQ